MEKILRKKLIKLRPKLCVKVNKPAGVVVFANRKGGDGIMTVRSMLPFVLTPPKVGTYATIRRPQPVQ